MGAQLPAFCDCVDAEAMDEFYIETSLGRLEWDATPDGDTYVLSNITEFITDPPCCSRRVK